jgi:two-component system cell cycle sensor histidine kinase/response regulator CckA
MSQLDAHINGQAEGLEAAPGPLNGAETAALAAPRGPGLFSRVSWLGAIIAVALLAFSLVDFSTIGPVAYFLLAGICSAVALAFFGLAFRGAGAGARGTLSRSVRGFAAPALEALPDPCLVTSSGGTVLFANEAYRALGLDDKGRAVPFDRLLSGQQGVEEALYQLAQAARLGLADEAELTFQPVAGAARSITALVSVRPLDGQGSLGRDAALWHIKDLTSERAAAKDAREERTRYLSYLDEAPFGFFSAGADGKVTYVNKHLAASLGLEPDQITARGMSLQDLAVGDVAALSPPVGEEGMDLQVVNLDLKGADGPLPSRIIQTYAYDSEGAPLATRSLVLDRSPGDEMEASLREAEMRFSRFFQHAPVGVVMLDGKGRVEAANAAFTGLVDMPVNKAGKFAEFLAPEDRDAFRDALTRGLKGDGIVSFEAHLAGQSDRIVQVYTSRLDSRAGAAGGGAEDGGTAQLALYIVDSTERKTLELQFAQSQKMQAVGQLAGGVAHDFNNLLTAIIGFCDLLLARHKAGDPSFADVMQIKQNANRAANLTRQLLAFSRRQTLRPKVLNLTDELAELHNLLDRLLGETVDLKIVHGRDLGLVKVDQSQLEQVIVNLSVNARDAMPEGGRLTIRTANVSEADSRALDHSVMPPGEYILVEVADTGTGISKEHLAKIFEPFFTTKDVNKGTGLGLSTVYGIVKQTGGYIFPYSTVGKGTTFRIYLPRYYETEKEKAAKAEEAAPADTRDLTGKGTILLVEDEDAVRTFAVRALTTRGYEVLEAESGEVALEIVDSHEGKIDLIVSDVVMPNMDGPTMLKELRSRGKATKIIFVSGYAEDAFAKSLDPNEDFRFLPKPFSLKQLAAAVKEAMDDA